jgi:hypothetical protein
VEIIEFKQYGGQDGVERRRQLFQGCGLPMALCGASSDENGGSDGTRPLGLLRDRQFEWAAHEKEERIDGLRCVLRGNSGYPIDCISEIGDRAAF